jgi:hypothetical protein
MNVHYRTKALKVIIAKGKEEKEKRIKDRSHPYCLASKAKALVI